MIYSKFNKGYFGIVFSVAIFALFFLINFLQINPRVDIRLYLYVIVGFILGVVLFFFGFGLFSQKRLIENTPTSKIGSIAMGPAEVYGKAVSLKSIKAPITNHDCVYYHYIVEEHVGSGKSSHWEVLKEDESSTNFYVQDKTGKVLVDPREAVVDIPQDYYTGIGGWSSVPPLIKNFAKRYDINLGNFLGMTNQMRFTEFYIAPGDMIYVFGTADENPNVGVTAHSTENVIIKKGKHLKFFYISDKPEKDVLKSLSTKVYLYIIGGGLLSIGSLAVLLYLNTV